MHNKIMNFIRLTLFCVFVLIGVALGTTETTDLPQDQPTIPEPSTESTQTTEPDPTTAPTEPTAPLETEPPTETTTPETEPAAATEPATEPETEPTETEPPYTQDELDLLALVIYQEAGGDYFSDETRLMVGTVVMNRIADPRFPDTMYGVLTQEAQYGTLHWTGPVWPSRASHATEAHAVERAYAIAERILLGERALPDDVIYQAEFAQGTEVVAYQEGMYFCR